MHASRKHPQVTVGASPRGGLALVALARGQAVLERRDFVTPEDVKAVAVPALAHRISLRPELWVRRVTSADVVADLLGPSRCRAEHRARPTDHRLDFVPTPRLRRLATGRRPGRGRWPWSTAHGELLVVAVVPLVLLVTAPRSGVADLGAR